MTEPSDFWCNRDHVSVVMGFLCYVDRWALTYAIPRLLTTMKSTKCLCAKYVIDDYLKSMGPSFPAALYVHKQVLTGSFLLSCLFGGFEKEPWNDIDIVGVYQKPDPFLFWLFESYGEKKTSENKVKRNDRSFRMNIYDDDDKGAQITGILTGSSAVIQFEKDDTVYETELKEPGKQNYPRGLPIKSRHFIVCKQSTESPFLTQTDLNHIHYYGNGNTAKHYISHFFDFDFCKVAYDGRKLYVNNWDSLFSRSCVVNWTDYVDIHEKCFAYHYDNRIRELYSRVFRRKQRYERRGFCVQIVNDASVGHTYEPSDSELLRYTNEYHNGEPAMKKLKKETIPRQILKNIQSTCDQYAHVDE